MRSAHVRTGRPTPASGRRQGRGGRGRSPSTQSPRPLGGSPARASSVRKPHGQRHEGRGRAGTGKAGWGRRGCASVTSGPAFLCCDRVSPRGHRRWEQRSQQPCTCISVPRPSGPSSVLALSRPFPGATWLPPAPCSVPSTGRCGDTWDCVRTGRRAGQEDSRRG